MVRHRVGATTPRRGTHLRAEDVDVRLGLLEAGAENGLHERRFVPARASRAPAPGRARQLRLSCPAERGHTSRASSEKLLHARLKIHKRRASRSSMEAM